MKNRACVLIAVLFAIPFLNAPANPQGLGRLGDRKITIKAEREPLGKVFHQLIYDMAIPIGFEKSSLDSDTRDFDFETNLPSYRTKTDKVQSTQNSITYVVTWQRIFKAKEHFITVDFENASIQEVFDSIVKQMVNYDWEIADDVVNIYPKVGRDPTIKSLLGLKIKDFGIGKQATVMEIHAVIFDLPEVDQFVVNEGLAVNRFRRNTQDLRKQLPYDITFSDLGFKELLNKLAKVKMGGWIIKMERDKSGNDKEVLDLDI